jgi:hypothetical protein
MKRHFVFIFHSVSSASFSLFFFNLVAPSWFMYCCCARVCYGCRRQRLSVHFRTRVVVIGDECDDGVCFFFFWRFLFCCCFTYVEVDARGIQFEDGGWSLSPSVHILVGFSCVFWLMLYTVVYFLFLRFLVCVCVFWPLLFVEVVHCETKPVHARVLPQHLWSLHMLAFPLLPLLSSLSALFSRDCFSYASVVSCVV